MKTQQTHDPAGGLSNGMKRDVERIRQWRKEKGQDPTPREWAAEFKMHPASADAALTRLAAAGYLAPRLPHRMDARTHPSPAELELAEIRELLREVDEDVLSNITVNDRYRRDEWRKKAEKYLNRNKLEAA